MYNTLTDLDIKNMVMDEDQEEDKILRSYKSERFRSRQPVSDFKRWGRVSKSKRALGNVQHSHQDQDFEEAWNKLEEELIKEGLIEG